VIAGVRGTEANVLYRVVSGRRAAPIDRVVIGPGESMLLPSNAIHAPGCLDFAVSADTIEPDRANVYEAWTDAQSLEAFRGRGADDPSFSFIVHADIERHEVSRSGPP
jgi:hypothetical protein